MPHVRPFVDPTLELAPPDGLGGVAPVHGRDDLVWYAGVAG